MAFSLFKRIMPVGVVTTTVVMISKTKLIPMKPKTKKAIMLGFCSFTPASKSGWKKRSAKSENTPVFIKGPHGEVPSL